ncbi:SusC/RagA family TonB-linked outer membrane protein [Cellulophaga sp. 20_2_10]|uniref:SusC/RagA family TonB-linked outer membrane protein n=1 Tax=Cellulophaga sp. 20_2_10 TaxID=2942476 RepID=UPI00201A8D4E|nr:SusC/RagA family TonB-linked outer membrane protein [Cellulophaga sp. 20_2_10]MCL5245070.1 SusC/RagA family TonB-linked outer membrane protein [Cellulophaga sp. 20_2_10]
MKTKKRGILALLLVFIVHLSFAQQKTISGTVTDQDGLPLPGVNILVKGTKTGTQTGFDGEYTIAGNVGQVLIYTYLGQKETTRTIDAKNSINVQMEEDAEALQEVVVTGVAGATDKRKLSVTVASVSAEELKKVPAGSAASALQGKVSGISVNNLGRPGQGATIILRGAANLYGSQSPLVILDGVFVEGGLADINVDDIASFEIVKGASASSLYGSRAGNGVIVISSKRGKIGKTEVTVRAETGFSKITNLVDTNQSHGYELASDWQNFQGQYTKYEGVTYPSNYQSVYANNGPTAVQGSRIESADGYSDNPYGVYNDFQDLFFKTGINKTLYSSISSGGERAKTFFSFENTDAEGILAETEGYKRSSIRANIDYQVFDWLTFKASNNYIRVSDFSPGGGDGVFRSITRLAPDANLIANNPDGQPYYFKPDPWESEIDNPLYSLYSRDAESKQQRFLGGYLLNFKLTDWLNADVEYSFENNTYRFNRTNKYETYTTSGDEIGFGYSKGSLNKNNSFDLSQKVQTTLNFAKTFGDLDVKSKLSYLAEDRHYEYYSVTGNDFKFKNLPSLDNFDSANVSANSNQQDERAQNMFAILGLVFKDRYIVDGLFRRDGSSLFGSENRWNNYYRVSGAYRISEDIKIPGIQELKINAARGTSGQRPGFDWQYEATALNTGVLSSARRAGNPFLKPSLTTETEYGLNAAFLNRFRLSVAYSNQVASDQFMIVNLFSPANAGKSSQWQNVGDLESDTYELSLNSKIIDKQNVKWNVGVNFTKSSATITKLNAPEQKVGPDDLFLIKEGVEFGSMFGRKFVTDLNTMGSQLPDGATIADYSVNSDGVVVETASIGTTSEAAIIEVDSDGVAVNEKIGNQNADFRVGITSNFSYKNFDFYMLWDWKQGGDVYNRNGQWNTISERNVMVDQAGKADSEKKTRVYYGSLYDVNQNNSFWVEDASYVKLREISLAYSIPSKVLQKINGNFFKEVKLSLIGRNILTISDYKGWDPEVSQYSADTQQYFAVDYGVYPNQSSYSMSLQLKF